MNSREATPTNGSESDIQRESPRPQLSRLTTPAKQLNQSELKLLHYYNISHAAAGTPVGKIYSSLFQKEQKQSKYSFPPVLSQKFCLECGDLLVPGISVSIKLEDSEPKDRDNKVLGKRLRFTCLSCQHDQFEEDIITEKEMVKPIVQESVNPVEKPVKSKAKERTKKRKMNNNLSNLLHQKKKQKEEQTKLNSLNLMEFLK